MVSFNTITFERSPWRLTAFQSVVLGRYAVSKTAYFVYILVYYYPLSSANSLLYQLWSLPSALVDILIAFAMTILVRGRLSLTHQLTGRLTV